MDPSGPGQEQKPDIEEEVPEPLRGRAGESGGAAEARNGPPAPWSAGLFPSHKRARLSGQMSQRPRDEPGRVEPVCLGAAGERRETSGPSRRRPLFSISHRILEKRSAPGSEEQLNFSGLLGSDSREAPEPPGLYPLIEKMFFILNALSSSVTQLHSKVDLLTLEVLRIKKRVQPAEPESSFRPPPEYLLTREELSQLREQTSGAGELGCRLLLRLFPELFRARDRSRRAPGSLHLQLVRNYVEACYPAVESDDVWRDECLGQVNDFFGRYWAQRDTEGTRPPREERPADRRQSSQALGLQATEELDERSSPDDFVLFLLRRLFPAVFQEGRVPEQAGAGAGQLVLDSEKMDVIRRYMEAHFPEVPEESWLQVCVQHLEDALEGPHGADALAEDGCELTCLSEDGPEVCESERPPLPPVDFDGLDIPPPSFPVPQRYLLSREQLRSGYGRSSSVGSFASRLLVLLFPELFAPRSTPTQYSCSGSPGRERLDPVRVNLLRHYVQLVYPPAGNDRVWTSEVVGELDERCRRRHGQEGERDSPSQPSPGEEPRAPSSSPEKSHKDFCKIPLEELSVSVPDFPVPAGVLLSSGEVRDIVQQSLSVGNFAARLLVRLFPELFTQENLRLQYNHSGACNKKQLDPVRLRLIRHYVESVFPVEKMEEVWHYECVPSIDERCRRPNRKKCDILKKARRTSTAAS